MGLETRYCLEQDPLKLKASFYAEEYNYVDIFINPCDNATSSVTCKTPVELADFIGENYLEVLFFYPVINYKDG